MAIVLARVFASVPRFETKAESGYVGVVINVCWYESVVS